MQSKEEQLQQEGKLKGKIDNLAQARQSLNDRVAELEYTN